MVALTYPPSASLLGPIFDVKTAVGCLVRAPNNQCYQVLSNTPAAKRCVWGVDTHYSLRAGREGSYISSGPVPSRTNSPRTLPVPYRLFLIPPFYRRRDECPSYPDGFGGRASHPVPCRAIIFQGFILPAPLRPDKFSNFPSRPVVFSRNRTSTRLFS